mmetsp:Transcript_7268/g.14417  ORF Transcript_7268/g.14417 Transcript_7268/m.14417 type:complete len:243 (-) Transcript_7268:326-1054(-)
MCLFLDIGFCWFLVNSSSLDRPFSRNGSTLCSNHTMLRFTLLNVVHLFSHCTSFRVQRSNLLLKLFDLFLYMCVAVGWGCSPNHCRGTGRRMKLCRVCPIRIERIGNNRTVLARCNTDCVQLCFNLLCLLSCCFLDVLQLCLQFIFLMLRLDHRFRLFLFARQLIHVRLSLGLNSLDGKQGVFLFSFEFLLRPDPRLLHLVSILVLQGLHFLRPCDGVQFLWPCNGLLRLFWFRFVRPCCRL